VSLLGSFVVLDSTDPSSRPLQNQDETSRQAAAPWALLAGRHDGLSVSFPLRIDSQKIKRRPAMRQLYLVAVLLLAFAGCAKVAQQAGISEHEMPVSGRGQLLQGADVRASGFLGDYSQLAPVKGVTGEWE
jgi:hypothetical protein